MASAFLGLQDQYESSMMKKKALEEELEDLEGKLLRAEKLLSGNRPSTILAPIQSAAKAESSCFFCHRSESMSRKHTDSSTQPSRLTFLLSPGPGPLVGCSLY